MFQLDGRQCWPFLCNMDPCHPGTQWLWPFTWWINTILFNTFHLAPTKGHCTWDWIGKTRPSPVNWPLWLDLTDSTGFKYYSMYSIVYIHGCAWLKCLSTFQPRLYSTVLGFWMSATLIRGAECQLCIKKMCCPGCSGVSCSPLSAPSMDQRGGGEWLFCSLLHRARTTYALAQSSRFSRLREEPSDEDTLHTVKVKSHGLFLFLAQQHPLKVLKTQTGFSLVLYTTRWSYGDE